VSRLKRLFYESTPIDDNSQLHNAATWPIVKRSMRESTALEHGNAMGTIDQTSQPARDIPASSDKRVLNAWCAWLVALATNAEAALAAALAYKQLEGPARESWLTAVEHDADRLNVPRVAVFAPLLAVESDPERRLRITRAMGPADEAATPKLGARGLCGVSAAGLRIGVVVTPLYLDFVQVLACGYRSNQGFDWVRHEPILSRSAAPVESQNLDGTVLESVPLRVLVDELAHAVVAHNRSQRPIPEALGFFAHLFDAQGSDGIQLPSRR
jgi:hypothetical protein